MTPVMEQAEGLTPAVSHRASKSSWTAGAWKGSSDVLAGKGRRPDDCRARVLSGL